MIWPFSLFQKKDYTTELLPDLNRQPVDREFSLIIEEYAARAGAEKIGLCFEGGGSKGRFQAGAAARLAEIGLLKHVNIMAGTSVGGLNVCILGKYLDNDPTSQTLVDIWRGIRKNSNIYNGEVPSDLWSGAKALLTGKLTGPSFLDTAPLYALVQKHLGDVTSFSREVYTCATDYVTKQLRVLNIDGATTAVDMALSTCAVPVMFPPYKDHALDGGCSDNAPVNILLEKGCTKIIMVYLDPDPSKIPVSAPLPNSLNTGTAAIAALFQVQSDRAYDKLESTLELRKLKGLSPIEVLHLWPDKLTGTLLDFESNQFLLQLGYDLACKYFAPDYIRDFLKA